MYFVGFGEETELFLEKVEAGTSTNTTVKAISETITPVCFSM